MDKLMMFVFVLAFLPNTPMPASQVTMLKSTLTGSAEVPGPGDPNGNGKAELTLNLAKGEVCFELSIHNVDDPTAAHIHEGGVGQAGGVKVSLDAPKDGSAKGCKTADAAVIKAIAENPAAYYINVHNAEFPNGAIRGQLSKQ